ncbi:hypothetical protein [Streptomyces gardneri]
MTARLTGGKLLCDQIGEPLDHGLAARRYAMSGDRRALHSTVL